jgi:hypothetical protein
MERGNMEREAYTIEEFCRSHGFSRAHYFNVAREGRGPRIMRVGARVLISKEAAAEWRRTREAAAENA